MSQLSESSQDRARPVVTQLDAEDAARAAVPVAALDTASRPEPTTRAELAWTIKQTFLDYLGSMSDGAYTLHGSVNDGPNGFVFPAAAGATAGQPPAEADHTEQANRTEVTRFSGAVEFTGHRGMLRVVISDPHLHHDGKTGFLTITDPDWEGRRMVLARFDVTELETSDPSSASAGRSTWRGTNVQLTADGADLFIRAYEPGAPLDDFVVLTNPASTPATTPTTTAATGTRRPVHLRSPHD